MRLDETTSVWEICDENSIDKFLTTVEKVFAKIEPAEITQTFLKHFLPIWGGGPFPRSPYSYVNILIETIGGHININGYCRQGRSQGKTGGNSPETEKNCCRKMLLFPKALFLVTNFPK